MNLEQRNYSLMIVSASDSFNSSVSSLLESSDISLNFTAKSINSAKRELSERSYDFILINSPLPDDPGIRFAIDVCGSSNTVVLMLFSSALYDESYIQITSHGVLAAPKPVTRNTVLTAFSWMRALRERLRKNEEKTISLEEKMKDIRLVNRAKWLLISELKMDEPQAHHYIEKQAMDQCVSKRQIAESIIRTYSH